jgi:NTE family protein
VEEWQRARRDGIRVALKVEHLMASSALPLIFPAQLVGNQYYCDGSLRLQAPLSPAIHLGADRILVAGIRDERADPELDGVPSYPSLGQIGGYLLDIVFMDNLNADVERASRINETISLLPPDVADTYQLRKIDLMVIRPSRDIRDIAHRHIKDLPWTIRMLLRGVGGRDSGWQLPSYLLFEPSFCGALLDLGYQDAMNQRDALVNFLGLEEAAPHAVAARQ